MWARTAPHSYDVWTSDWTLVSRGVSLPLDLVWPDHHCVICDVQNRWSRKALGHRRNIDTLDNRDLFSRDLEGRSADTASIALDEDSRDLEGQSADFASVALDELADSALIFVLDDPAFGWRDLNAIFWSMKFNGVVHFLRLLSRPRHRRRLMFAFLRGCLLYRNPLLLQPVFTQITGEILRAKCQSFI